MGVGSGTLAPLPGAPLLSGDDARRGRTKDGRVHGKPDHACRQPVMPAVV